MSNVLVLYDIPSYAEIQWEEKLKAAGWKWISVKTYAKAFAHSDQALPELEDIFKTLDVTLSDEDDEHVRIVFPGRDQQGNPQIGIKTLYGKKPG
jgi:hypothetical protein